MSDVLGTLATFWALIVGLLVLAAFGEIVSFYKPSSPVTGWTQCRVPHPDYTNRGRQFSVRGRCLEG